MGVLTRDGDGRGGIDDEEEEGIDRSPGPFVLTQTYFPITNI